jgi:putative endonuclease
MARRPLIAVYMEASRPFGVIYIGVTSNLFQRGFQHLEGKTRGFAADHGYNMLVWYEEFALITDAIQREKSLKRWNRAWKMQLIEHRNPDWLDLYPALCGTAPDPRPDTDAADVAAWLRNLDDKPHDD